MYRKFFYLNERPFHITPDPRFLYLSSKHREALDLLLHCVTDRKGFAVLTGEVGTGKTTLCRALIGKLPKGTESSIVLNPLLSEVDFVISIIQDFGLSVRHKSIKAYMDVLNEFLVDVSSRGGNAVVIIDEAQNLSPRTMEMIRLLSNFETDKEKLLQILMIGQPSLREKLKLPQLRQLNQRVIVRHHLYPLSSAETEFYIQSRIFSAGGRGAVNFTPGALRAVFNNSLGVPRIINIICDRALTAAFVEGKRLINRKIIKMALDELKSEGYITAYGVKPVYSRFYDFVCDLLNYPVFSTGNRSD